jgi:hypothetical protein
MSEITDKEAEQFVKLLSERPNKALSPREAGSRARSQGAMIWQNPYPTTDPKSGWKDWEDGWLDRDAAVTNGDHK